MKSAFVAVSYIHRHDLREVIDVISEKLSSHGYEPFIFVQKYDFHPDQTQQMMQKSTQHIQACDLFIAELTHKAVGVGIEAGYAHALNKPIVYVHHVQADLSTTLNGIADYRLMYRDTESLGHQLIHILTEQLEA